MKKSRRTGRILMLLGLAMLVAAGGWALHNARLEQAAERSAKIVVQELAAALPPAAYVRGEDALEEPIPEDAAQETAAVTAQTEPTITLGGEAYLGILSIPALGLDLPVREDWSYEAMQLSPCRYAGSAGGEDLVIMAHNYKSHFAYLDQLPEGSAVIFTTAGGDELRYAVSYVEVLQPTAVEDMTAGEFPLTLFTCTYGGQSRLAVRCDWDAG